MVAYREEQDSMGTVRVPKNRLWGAQTQRSLLHFHIGDDLMPKEMIDAFAILKKAAAEVNCKTKRLSNKKAKAISSVCDELLKGKHREEFPLHVWMTGSGTQYNMNVNEVIANRCSQLAKQPLGSKKPIHPNDDVNMSQSSNDTFPTAMHIASASVVMRELLPTLREFQKSFEAKAKAWKGIVKLGRTHLQDATPLTLGQEFSGYADLIKQAIEQIENAMPGVYHLTLGGTAVGTGINTVKGYDLQVAKKIASLTRLPFVTAPNKFTTQGSHNALVHLSGALKALASALFKIANDIRLLSCGPRSGFYELILPANEPGSSIMPGKVNPTQCEALSMVAIQVMANDVAVSFGDASGILEMNVYKPLIVYNILHSVRLIKDSCEAFRKYVMKGIKPNRKQIRKFVDHSLMLVTALSPKIGYDKASQVAHHAFDKGLSLKEAALDLGYVTENEYDQLVNPIAMCFPKGVKIG